MSDKDLKLTHKLFAIVEGWINSTKVHDVNVRPESEYGAHGEVKDLDFSFEILNHSLDLDIPAQVTDTPLTMQTVTCEILQQLLSPQIFDASLEGIQTRVVDENVEGIRSVAIHSIDQELTFENTHVQDFFKNYNINSKLLYTTSVRSVDISKLKPVIKNLPIDIRARVKENLRFIRRINIERQSTELSLIQPKEQLTFWKKAVEKTGKEPKYLTLLGVYTGIPYNYIETDKVTVIPGRKTLTYQYKQKIPANPDSEQMKDIALFSVMNSDTSGAPPSLIMVKK